MYGETHFPSFHCLEGRFIKLSEGTSGQVDQKATIDRGQLEIRLNGAFVLFVRGARDGFRTGVRTGET